MAYRDEVLADAPLAYYPLGEATSGTTPDVSGNARDATISGTLAVGTDALIPGDAAIGASNVQARQVVTPAGAQPLPAEGAMEWWATWTGGTGTQSPLGRPIAHKLWVGNGTNLTFYLRQSNNTWSQLNALFDATAGGLHYYVLQWQSGVLQEIYIDNVLIASRVPGTVGGFTADLTAIGADSDKGWQGRIGHCALYDHLLSPTRRAAHYNAGLTVPEVNDPPSAPAAFTAPVASQKVGDALTVAWTAATDPDAGDTLTYEGDYSADGGTTWQTLFPRQAGLSFDWDTSALSPGEEYKVRVRAHDGTVYGDFLVSDAFEIAHGSAPSAPGTYTAPEDGTNYDAPFTVAWGAATDADDDPLQYEQDYSTDGGKSWLPLHALQAATTYDLDPALLPATTQAMLRVRAHDGTSYGPYRTSGLFYLRAQSAPPAKPTIAAAWVGVYGVGLVASEYTGLLRISESRWQIVPATGSFDEPEFDSQTDAGAHLAWTKTATTLDYHELAGPVDYIARVQYKDPLGQWSEWSDPVAFTTAETYSTNAGEVFRARDLSGNSRHGLAGEYGGSSRGPDVRNAGLIPGSKYSFYFQGGRTFPIRTYVKYDIGVYSGYSIFGTGSGLPVSVAAVIESGGTPGTIFAVGDVFRLEMDEGGILHGYATLDCRDPTVVGSENNSLLTAEVTATMPEGVHRVELAYEIVPVGGGYSQEGVSLYIGGEKVATASTDHGFFEGKAQDPSIRWGAGMLDGLTGVLWVGGRVNLNGSAATFYGGRIDNVALYVGFGVVFPPDRRAAQVAAMQTGHYADEVLADSPAVYWPFDDPAGPDRPVISVQAQDANTALLQSSDYSSLDVGFQQTGLLIRHRASRWQLTSFADTAFATPLWDSGIDTNNLTTATVPLVLEPTTTYLARVLHQDGQYITSPWSLPIRVRLAGQTVHSGDRNIFFGEAGGPRLLFADSGTDDDGLPITLLALPNRIAPAGEDGECMFYAATLAVRHLGAVDLTITPKLNGRRLLPIAVSLEALAEVGVEMVELALAEVYQVGGTSYGVRGTWLSFEITATVTDEFLSIEPLEVEIEPVIDSHPNVTYTAEEEVSLPADPERVFLGAVGSGLYLADRTGADAAATYALRISPREATPAGVHGECVFLQLSLLLGRDNRELLFMRLTPVVDGVAKAAIDIPLEAVDAPTWHVVQIALGEDYVVGGQTVGRYDLRGTAFTYVLESVGALPDDANLLIDPPVLEYEVVTPSRVGAHG